jgi:hypothetical protein
VRSPEGHIVRALVSDFWGVQAHQDALVQKVRPRIKSAVHGRILPAPRMGLALMTRRHLLKP